jgi:hypothetical protein
MKLLVFVILLFTFFGSSSFTITIDVPVTEEVSYIKGPNLDFVLKNQTGYDIESIYVAPTSEREWGEDIMGVDLLEEGESVEISFDAGENTKNWDIYVTWKGYSAEEDVFWVDFDLSTISEITLFYDAKTGKTWAEYK